jgi:hypothetical protein
VIRPLRPAARCRDVSVEALIRELLDVITAACRARNRGAVRRRCWPSPDKNAPAASRTARRKICPWSAQNDFLGRLKCEKCLILLTRPEGFEPPAPRFVVWRSMRRPATYLEDHLPLLIGLRWTPRSQSAARPGLHPWKADRSGFAGNCNLLDGIQMRGGNHQHL